ncbi:chemotaxis protein CheV [Litoribrevibacter albus]|uniref:Chemotaxis protein CheW n=1 Tax=Litoribrevibacter albus TaxID=1473156 RepID=A0AA37W6F4_9GAMM|nr:chemotaxis protein CheV [Litoribrevibacter albus]GLQ31917.1 chemotaxis protein CheW [Litoribrevibacter albus]
MSGILDSVDSRTQLVGENRLEILTFQLHGHQQYAINVFKIQEVLPLPNLTLIPHRHPHVCGVTHLRGATIPVIDLSAAIGMRPIIPDEKCTIIVTEYNRSVQAFLVGGVSRIVNLNWEDILPPPQGSGRQNFLTAITRIDEKIVEIIDVEKVLAEISPYDTDVSDDVLDPRVMQYAHGLEILLVDDSTVAISQASETLHKIGIKVTSRSDGLQALEHLKQLADSGVNPPDKYLMLITDAEMPSMDGYRLTTEIRNDPRMKDLFIVLHTSLSGGFNKAMVEKVGCNDFLSKFQPDMLAQVVQNRIKSIKGL